MIAHVALFKTHPGVSPEDSRVRTLIGDLDQLKDLPGIQTWKHGANFTVDPQAWDYALYAEFESENALLAYYEAPLHAAIVGRWAEVGRLHFADVRL